MPAGQTQVSQRGGETASASSCYEALVAEGATIVPCPLCGTPHRAAAVKCDSCGQALHGVPNVWDMEAELGRRKLQMWGSATVIVGMIALSVWISGGRGIFLALAPFVWFGWSWMRFRVLKRHLARLAAKTSVERVEPFNPYEPPSS